MYKALLHIWWSLLYQERRCCKLSLLRSFYSSNWRRRPLTFIVIIYLRAGTIKLHTSWLWSSNTVWGYPPIVWRKLTKLCFRHLLAEAINSGRVYGLELGRSDLSIKRIVAAQFVLRKEDWIFGVCVTLFMQECGVCECWCGMYKCGFMYCTQCCQLGFIGPEWESTERYTN